MAINLSKFRRTEITITYSRLYGILGQRYKFDANGELIDHFWDMTPPWLMEQLTQIASRQPHVSETKTRHFYDPETGKLFATALVERYIDLTIGDVLRLYAEHTPNKDMIRDGETGEAMTYYEMDKRSDHLARHLVDLGCKPKDTIAVIMHNCVAMPMVKLAAMKSGGVIVNFNPHENVDSLRLLLEKLEISTVILRPGRKGKEDTIQKFYDICPELTEAEPGDLHASALPKLRRVIVVGTEKQYPGTIDLNYLMSEAPACTAEELAERTRNISFRDIATIIHTSGTTGLAKGAMLTHGMLLENAAEHMRVLSMTSNDVALLPIPMFHVMGIVGAFCTLLISGATLVTLEKPTPEKMVAQLDKHRCTVVLTVPSVAHAVCDRLQAEGSDVKTNLRLCALAGAPCTETVLKKINTVLGVDDVIIMYGMTEASAGVSSTRSTDPVDVKLHTVGREWRGSEVKLMNTHIGDDGLDEGEICIRGYNVLKGYYRDPEATKKAVDCDGWLHTGDLGQITEDGNIVITGRLKDIIICKGENVSPKEVELVLEQHDAVSQAIAVGAKDDVEGEVIVAYVQLAPHKQATGEELRSYCLTKLSKLKTPRHIEIVEDYPKSETGKILRRELRKMADELHKNLV